MLLLRRLSVKKVLNWIFCCFVYKIEPFNQHYFSSSECKINISCLPDQFQVLDPYQVVCIRVGTPCLNKT